MKFSYCLCLAAALSSIIVLGHPSAANAQSSVPLVSPLFTDNMVIQRGMTDHVWGWTTPGASVTVQFDGKIATAVAGQDGSWLASIGPFKAGGPYKLTISGPQTVTFSNVLVGDVWLCSGQSNMEFGIGNSQNGAQEIAAANYPNIRMFTVGKTISLSPQSLTAGQWLPVTPDNIKNEGTWNGFTAAGYFFARDLQSSVNVPIGLIQSSWGGTPAEAWTSKEALLQHMPDFAAQVNAINPTDSKPHDERVADWYSKFDPGAAGNWQDPATDTSAWKSVAVPGYFQQAGVPELQAVNGIVWFRTQFDLPASDTGKDGVLHLVVDDNDTTWVNGQLVGATEGFSAQRAYAIPAALLKPTGNVVVIRNLDTGGVGGIYGDPAALKVSFAGGDDVPLAGQWSYRLAAPLTQIGAYPDAISGNPSYPTVLFNGMISPIDDFTIKGALWYQGEANAGQPLQYRTLLPTMITDWRTRWNEGNFPFLIVQLAGWQPGGNWQELRQAQWLTAQSVPSTGIVTAIDIGDKDNIHPTNKQEVGRRLALVAEATVYGKKIAYSGPIYKSATADGSSMRVSFSQTNGGLVAQGGTPLQGFELAGGDGVFYPAQAVIDGNNVVVTSSQVAAPAAVQYDWSGFPAGNLYNQAGLPTFPFKSDEK